MGNDEKHYKEERIEITKKTKHEPQLKPRKLWAPYLWRGAAVHNEFTGKAHHLMESSCTHANHSSRQNEEETDVGRHKLSSVTVYLQFDCREMGQRKVEHST